MEQLNKVELRGYVGAVNLNDVAIRLTLATSYAYMSIGGDAIIETTWHNVTMLLNKETSEYVKNITKGNTIYVRGRIRNQRFVDADGIDHYSTEVLAKEIQILNNNETLEYERR